MLISVKTLITLTISNNNYQQQHISINLGVIVAPQMYLAQDEGCLAYHFKIRCIAKFYISIFISCGIWIEIGNLIFKYNDFIALYFLDLKFRFVLSTAAWVEVLLKASNILNMM